MPDTQATYHERLLHWIWKTHHFDSRNLQTISGEPIQLHDLGRLNTSDGPDFSSAAMTIGSLRWYGDVEIHWRHSDWRAHHHDGDPRYDNVILHVVFRETDRRVLRSDASPIPTLWLEPYLTKPLASFLSQYLEHPQLPCAEHLSYISEEAFDRQLRKAHREYFEQKVEDLLAFYDADLPPSQAWLKLLAIALFDGLGISQNRSPMRQLARQLFDMLPNTRSPEALQQQARKSSGLFGPDPRPDSLLWNHKGCRPSNHPEHRIMQGVLALCHIYQRPFKEWLTNDPEKLWNDMLRQIDTTPALGTERGDILYGTVFLPALYLLGRLFFAHNRESTAWERWQAHRVRLPKSLLRPLSQTGLSPALYRKKLGTIHQLRHYCRAGRCQQCFVFKNAISP